MSTNWNDWLKQSDGSECGGGSMEVGVSALLHVIKYFQIEVKTLRYPNKAHLILQLPSIYVSGI